MPPGAVTFDFGQTLAELDCELLSARLRERGVVAQPERLHAALPEAWRRYDRALAGSEGGHPWQLFMKTLLEEGGVQEAALDQLVSWLWAEQPRRNLWRKPIPGMIEVVRKLSRAGTKVGVISNSEGRLAQLAEELGWRDDFLVIADSGVLGFAKPGARIFEWAAERLGVAARELVHVGDSWAADVEGIRRVGGRAIWFGGASFALPPPSGATEDPRLKLATSAEELEGALRAFQVSL